MESAFEFSEVAEGIVNEQNSQGDRQSDRLSDRQSDLHQAIGRDRRVNYEPCETWLPKETRPVDVLPYITVSREPRIGKVVCACDIQSVELSLNRHEPTTFHSQDKHEDFSKLRTHLTPEDVSLSCDYMAGKHVMVKVCYLKQGSLEFDEKLIVLLKSGDNEIRLPARRYVHEFVSLIDKGFTYYCEGAHQQKPTDELSICRGHAYAEFYTDATSKWVVLRQYFNTYIAEQIHVSAKTWIEMRRLTPMISQNIQYYNTLFIQGHQSMLYQQETPDLQAKSNAVRAIQF
jgi:hypothetical protein